ncbi:hypothetical protein LCGC14_1031460, partial [marine sediment metagenome]
IAACRTNVPMLVAALEEAQGKLAAVEKWAQKYANGKKASPVLVLGMRVASRAILRILKEENDG